MYRGLCVCLSVGMLVIRMSCAKTTEPIEMPFGGGGGLINVRPRNHVSNGVQIVPQL